MVGTALVRVVVVLAEAEDYLPTRVIGFSNKDMPSTSGTACNNLTVLKFSGTNLHTI